MKVVSVLGMIMLIFSSCQKIMEYYSINSTTSELPVCRIRSYSTPYFESISRANIDYDNNGNPVRITYLAEWLPNGKAVEKLVYDSLNRLISHEPMIELNNTRRYVYDGGSRTPLRDTATDFQGKKYVETFKTDMKGRIIEMEIRWVYTPPEIEDDFPFQTEVYRFYYDARGNRQVNPFDYPWHKTIRYSQQPSLYSLHPAWQLIHRDYSKNGITNVTSYNEAGLPLTFTFDEFAYWQPFLDLTQNSTIVYDCGESVTK
jgi:hypothetical protein